MGSKSHGQVNYCILRVRLGRKTTIARCATGRGDTMGESAELFVLLGGQIWAFKVSKGAHWKVDKLKA